jgi:hypothetical protein
MYRYTVRVRTGPTFSDMVFTASSVGELTNIIEAQFGQGSMMGVIREDYIG